MHRAPNESMRLKPVAAFLGLETLQPMVVADVEMPARTRLFFLNWPAQIEPHHFADPLRFDPTRWSAAQGSGEAHNPRAYVQFGAGPRVCPGLHLSGVERRMVLSMLLCHFEIELVRDPAEVQEALHFTCTSDRMPARLRLRAPAATSANGRACGRTLPVRAGLTVQAAACSATVANASGQCGSGRGTGAPASSKRRNTAA